MTLKSSLKYIGPLIIGLSILTFIIIKANLSSFTHDESFSYLHYPSQDFMDLISFKDYYTNNHILNSISLKFIDSFVGNSELLLRLPNLILFCFYLIYSFKLFKEKNPVILFAIFTLMSINIMLVDLFGLARGYGLSFGFGTISTYHLLAYVKKEQLKDLILFHLTALLACLSNFTLVTIYSALLVVYTTILLIKHILYERNWVEIWNKLKLHIIPFSVVFLVMYEPIRRLLTESDLGFGGKEGFFHNTVFHFVMNMLSLDHAPEHTELYKWIVLILGILPLLIILKKIYDRNEIFLRNHIELIFTSLLMIVVSLIIIAQHIILDADYPVSRFSMFLFPIYMIQFGFFMNYLTTVKWLKAPTIILAVSASILTILNFISKADLYVYKEWEYDSQTRNMISVLTNEVDKENLKSMNMGIDWMFEPAINYYIVKNQLTWLNTVDRNGISPTDEYLYIESKHLPKYYQFKYCIVKRFKQSKTILLRNIQ